MTVIMPKNIQEERLRWVFPIIRKEIKLCEAKKVCPHSERSLKRWVKAYRDGGKVALIAKSTTKDSTKGDTNTYQGSYHYTSSTNRALRQEASLEVGERWSIGTGVHYCKILKSEGFVREYRTKKVKYKYIRAQRKPGELVEIDVKYLPGYIQIGGITSIPP